MPALHIPLGMGGKPRGAVVFLEEGQVPLESPLGWAVAPRGGEFAVPSCGELTCSPGGPGSPRVIPDGWILLRMAGEPSPAAPDVLGTSCPAGARSLALAQGR